MENTIKLIAACAYTIRAAGQNDAENLLKISNDTDLSSLEAAPSSELQSELQSQLMSQLKTAQIVELHFPKFTDGRAFSQAVQLRRRHQFKGEIVATGDVLIDQLVQLQRAGFTTAVLRDDQDVAHGAKLLAHYNGFYQGDDRAGSSHAKPRFAST